MDEVVGAQSPKSILVEKASAILSYPIVRAVTRRFAVFPVAPEEPIRAELFSIERLEQHGESLAVAQRIAPTPTTDRRLAKRLRENDSVLRSAYAAIAMSIQDERTVTPAADWFVDNFHLVDEQVHEIRRDLPPGYYRQLPKLADGPLKGYPRVFGLAWAFVAHTDSHFEPETLSRFIRAYQRVEPLTIGELWAIAITLRIVLVENLRRLAEAIVSNRAARQEADLLADRLLGVGNHEAEPAHAVLRRVDRAVLPPAFAVQLVRRLRDQDPTTMPALRWLGQRLTAQGTTADDAVQEEHQRQGATNVTVRNIITSMRLMSGIDWKVLFEGVSPVDAVLRAGSDFAALDFSTRDLYRRAIEELARGSKHPETEVAIRAMDAANRAGGAPGAADATTAAPEQDPGHYLIGNGRRQFERELNFRVPVKEWLARANTAVGIFGYLGIVAAVTLVLVAPILDWIAVPGGIWGIVVFGLLALMPAQNVAIALVNSYVIRRFRATILPSLELADGVPSNLRTMLVIPTMLTSHGAIAEQIERLLIHHLANTDADLYLALLSDWTDARNEKAPDDDELLETAAAGIARLNRQYGRADQSDRFFLLHRRRVWDETQRSWIGWERKRGKLHELNRLLRGATDTTFVAGNGQPPIVPADIRYVITLDADTRLPRGAARRLIGKMAHPLNRPMLDPIAKRVIDGHAVLQPRVTPSMPTGQEGSAYQRVFSGARGLDPYAFAVSDVYQDLFGEGSYSGKGIYDVDAFEAALAARIPADRLLSHDLFEGIFARAGLVSDVEVVEEFPSRYDIAAARQHRWARGDWQLLPWIFGRKRPTKDGPGSSALPAIGRWKMIDNLRRSLLAPATYIALLAGWILPPASARSWTGFILATVAIPALLPIFIGVAGRDAVIWRRSRLRAIGADLNAALVLVVLVVTLLAHEAWLMGDAIVRTLFRLFVSHRLLLEWITAAQAKIGARLDLAGFYWQMAGGIVLAAAAAILVAGVRPDAWPVAAPFIALWLSSPAIARWISLPPAARALSGRDRQFLRQIARRTWCFFDTFVTVADNMLPPDNFQEDPVPTIAHRTSPTNLGLYLLSVTAAHDFGWLGTADAIERLEATLHSMNRLERCRGHFYNWYGTLDLVPLAPKYISTVDSGNLAGHLIALWNACAEMARRPLTGPQWLAGIGDALDLLRDSLSGAGNPEMPERKQFDTALDDFGALLQDIPATPRSVAARLEELARRADKLGGLAREMAAENAEFAETDALAWAEALGKTVLSHRRDVELMLPWLASIERENPPDESLAPLLTAMPAIADLPRLCETAISALTCRRVALGTSGGNACTHLDALIDGLRRSVDSAAAFDGRLATLGGLARELFDAMKFDFLFEPERELLSIGYRVADESLDPGYYDLLASEARLASFVAIAKGDIPTRHWFRLGRALAPVPSGSALISWTGSMFEYLMPALTVSAPAGSLLDRTNRQIVHEQIVYGAQRGIPWGVSESTYNARDLQLTYQYFSFGVPHLGLKRGLSDDNVVAPYATALATMVDPQAAARNFHHLADLGARGRYGWYDALDYTKTRLPKGADVAVVRAYMAHHQGMSVIAIANTLLDGAFRARFHQEPIVQATELLLQERMPNDVAIFRPRIERIDDAAKLGVPVSPAQRRFISPHDSTPRTHLLSNGRYAVMLTAAGSGYSRWRDIAVTRWREDVTCDGWGTYVFLRDTRTDAIWSAGYQPSGVTATRYEVAFTEGRAEIVRRDGAVITTLEVAVSSEDDAEVRRVSITNLGNQFREIELTSYAEIVLAPHADDDAHPAFSKLFVQTEFAAAVGAVLATRRPRSPGEAQIWVAHLAVVEGECVGEIQFETDRARFIGRGRETRTAIAMAARTPLSNTVGTVLDPVVSIRRRVRVPPRATVRVAFWTLIAPSRQEALDLADKHHEAMAFDRATTLAWTQAQVQLHHLGIGADEAHLFQRLANRVLYSDPSLRPPSETLKRGDGSVSMLWPQGISGDLPIVLVRIDETADLGVVRLLLLAHEYWRMKRLAVDLVILNERAPSYLQDLETALEALVRANQSRAPAGTDTRGAVFILRADLISVELRNLLQTAARAVLVAGRGSLADQVKRAPEPQPAAPPPKHLSKGTPSFDVPPGPPLEFFNGLGGFADNGREYRTVLDAGQRTPSPWINVISNRSFGFHSSVEGSGHTWSRNSQQNHLTPWSNDPVSDAPGEAIYLRDEDSGDLWTPTALPIREEGSVYIARHGQGYSRFEHVSHGISVELLQYVPVDDSIKISRLKIVNLAGRSRRISVTAYVEWVLGAARGATAPFIVTEIDTATGAMFARNPWSIEFGQRVTFADLAGGQQSWTGDRTEFLGRNSTLDQPVALARTAPLSKRVGAGLDPCGALQTRLQLKANAATEIVFLLGDAPTIADAQSLLKKYRAADLDAVLDAVTRLWDDALGTVQVTTPDRAMDILLNRWLLYQTLSCRVWARAAFYQASGAYGFRDQLQDIMALCVARPDLAREHLLRAAGRQFIAGDMQHWWLPETGRGVRTRVSDDRVWLPYVVAHYVEVTGDIGVLDELIPFLDGPMLRDGETDSFFQPTVADEQATLFEHCARALDQSLAVGGHGLPLIGTGDWNDGMNRVGDQGKGESVWLGWFLHATITAFARLADGRQEQARIPIWRRHTAALAKALEREGWDGEWYRRAYFDDGTPLGSAANDECRIDAIAQSWSVISRAAKPDHAAQAMIAFEQQLIRRDDGLTLLFAPPFDRTPLDPGYIKGYPPGIRENGGQYTHGAVWSVIAFAMLGDGNKAGELFAMMNPINHARTPDAVQRYKVEPYVMCGDIHSFPPHTGRGGWSWYTGSAGWMYRAGLESILGFRLQGSSLLLDPCIPKAWPGFQINFRYRTSRYDIAIENPRGVSHGIFRAELDGVTLAGKKARFALVDDSATHHVRVVLG